MNAGYFKLFENIALGTANVAERSMELNKKTNDLTAYKNAMQMRDNFQELMYKAKEKKDFDQNDFRNLYIGTTIMIEGLEAQLRKEQKVLDDYKNIVMGALKQVIDAPEDKYEELAQTLFEIENPNI